MAQHVATVFWQRKEALFSDNKYSRAHEWRFDGGARVAASASPDIVPLPYSDASAVDPEEAFVASAASCHMLFFLSFAQREKLVVDRYTDEAVGFLTKSEAGKLWVSRIELNPEIIWSGQAPSGPDLQRLHHDAHEACFIANSIRSEIVVKA